MVAAEELEESVPEEAFACTTEEHEMMKAIGGALASAYGEITRAGFSALGKNLRLERDDVFVDCGSGLGRHFCRRGVASGAAVGAVVRVPAHSPFRVTPRLRLCACSAC